MVSGNGSVSGGGTDRSAQPDVDVVVVGAGFAGLYLLHRLRKLGMTATVFESGGDVGGTWYWNRYPGARCDVQSIDYSYSFDRELDDTWVWSEKYATQPEILRYLQHVTERHDLRGDIEFDTRVEGAVWDEAASRWRLTTSSGTETTCRFYVMATGCLSLPKELDILGAERFTGETYFTSRWPHEGVDLTGKRVAVIGTGSSAIQAIPVMARQAAELTVYQRTPNFSIPARNGPIPEDRRAALEADRPAYRESAKWTRAGVPGPVAQEGALQVGEEERQARYEAAWERGELFAMVGAFNDIATNQAANDTAAEFIRAKIRAVVDDPETADALCPTDHPFGTKRPCLDTGYYQTFNLAHVRLVDLRRHPIATVTETGIDTDEGSATYDVIVFATGFDAMTGAIVAVDIAGRDGLTLKDKWAEGPKTYLGLMVAGFPNLFTITGPGSPSVLSNMALSIEQHVDWIADCLRDLQAEGLDVIEPIEEAEAGWVQHVNDFGDLTLFPRANSWYMGANVPGKPRVFLPYVGGVGTYRGVCDEVVERDYLGFVRRGEGGERRSEGIVRALQPDVAMVLDMMAGLGLPAIETLSVAEARAFMVDSAAARPPGPDVGEIVDGTLPGPAGDLAYRLYRPPTDGPHPVVVYFHGGGWVLGSHDSDDPFCRDLCVRSGSIVISVDYRHAPEARFPAAPDDGFAAVQWVAAHTSELGGIDGQLVVAGWSAGANVAAVVCQLARDAGGPAIAGQLLVTPVTDSDPTRGSYVENADGYMLTAPLMAWFWDHYADDADRAHPKASPLRAESLADLPPALIVTAEFDPLRDEGAAYAEALEAAGNQVVHLSARGHVHTSLTAVDAVLSGAATRAEMGAAVRGFVGAPVSRPDGPRMTVQERSRSVPVLDVGAFRAGEPGALDATAAQLRDALEQVGFFFIVGHGVPWDLVRDTFTEAARFHALPAATKEAIPFGGDRGGYLTLGGGTSYASRIAGDVRKPNLNAAIFVRGGARSAGNQFPPEAELPRFRAAVDCYMAAVHELATSLLPLYAVALGLEPEYFASSFVDADTTLRMSHYPVVPHEEHQWGLAAHTDSNFMTLLPDNEVTGLEIHPEGSDWIQPPVLAESFLVNSGDILRRWTNDHFLSTGHRVLNASGRDRYAIPYFLGPRPDAPIVCLPTCSSATDPPRYRPTTYGEYAAWFTNRNYAASTGQAVGDDEMP